MLRYIHDSLSPTEVDSAAFLSPIVGIIHCNSRYTTQCARAVSLESNFRTVSELFLRNNTECWLLNLLSSEQQNNRTTER